MANSSYRLWIRQVSNDGGQTWSNMEAHKVGDIIDYSSTCSGEPIYRWHLENINDRYDCDSETKTKYQISVYQVSMDNGDSWEDVTPLQIQRSGTTIPNSVDCGYIQYRWHESETETICDFQEHAKYKMLSYQYSKDGGSTWLEFVPREYKKGDLIEAKSVDCGYVIEYRWVAIDGDYECDSTTNNKYAVEKKQYSENGGQWYDVSPTETRRGSVIEEHSFDCGYTEYRWIVDDDDYDCDTTTHTKYQVEKKQYTTDGINWIDEGTTRRGDVIEYYSVDCGYVEYRYVVVEGEYLCDTDTYTKYQALKQQYTTDGVNWNDVEGGAYVMGDVIEYNSEDCGYVVEYRWIENGYDCDSTNYIKHQYYKKQYYDEEWEQWLDVEPLETKVVNISFSEDCGYVPPTPSVSGCTARLIWLTQEKPLVGGSYHWVEHDDTTTFDDCKIPSSWRKGYWIRSIEIGNGITEIGDNAFNPDTCESMLTSVALSNSLNVIGEWSFANNTKLTSIYIPNSVTTIGGYAFYKCSSLTSVKLPTNLTSIGNGVFNKCTSLTSITIPNSVTSIGYYAFEGCRSLTSVTIGSSVTSIDIYAFSNCSGLTSVDIGESVTSIGDYAFQYCRSLTNITYQGTKAQWEVITKGSYWNSSVPITVVHCTDGDIHFSN